MQVFSSKWENFLFLNNITSISEIWKLSPEIEIDKLDENSSFSLTSRLNLKDRTGQAIPMILKRQWLPKSAKNNIKLLPVVGETSNYKKLRKKGLKVLPSLAASGEIKTAKGVGAFALYKELDEYISADHLLSTWGKSPLLTRNRKRILLTALGESLRQLHEAKFVHRALSPKHIFIRFIETTDEISPKVDTRIVDLEEGRLKLFFGSAGKQDLIKLSSYTSALSSSEKLRFFLAYSGKQRLNKRLKAQVLSF
ncbi:MAG: lipopolysaccharide kinase InaA family protein [Bdellovibrionota bacterium]